jgi:hypothetical protein
MSMSKERDLLRNALEELLLIVEIHQKCTKNNFAWAEVEYAKELLAQPEQEPMTAQEISQGFQADKDAINAESYWAGVALAEKHYGVKINETL